MSEFDKLKDDAEQYAKDHPEQVHEAEQDAERAAEKKFGFGGDQQPGGDQRPGGDQEQGTQQDQGQQDQQAQGQGGQDITGSGQDQAAQGQ